ncbi:MAG TPA: (Fe-S)-binding protein, partial [Dehalococcoidia bacterium]|nr:(Fe-S)-binding protein [Dehalococcoidia bacterium]
ALSVLSGGISIPKLSKPFLAKRLPAITHPSRELKVRGQVAVFPGCAFEFFFADIGESVVRDLAAAGYNVIYPQELTCCGLAVRSAGDLKTAQQMAQRNISILAPYDRIVTGCATCSSALKNYASWFPHDAEWQQKAAALAAKVSDLAEFMAVEGFKPQPVEPVIVTYHDPCHMKWLQGIYDQPRDLLRSIEGLKYVEMEGADECCGLGGAFSITHRDTSLAIQAKKMQSIRNTGASIVATSCPGCIVQLRDGVRRHHLNVEVMHISQLLDGQKGLPQRHRSAAAAE